MSALAKKGSAYARRNDASTIVPLEPDSDPDFNPGAYVPEPKKRARRSGGSRKSGEPPNKKRKGTESSAIRSRSPSFDEECRTAVPLQKNLLAEFFGNLGLMVQSESEKEDADDEEEEEEEEDEDEDVESRHSDRGRSPVSRKYLAPLKKTSPPAKPTVTTTSLPQEDSVTEPESEGEVQWVLPIENALKRSAQSQPNASNPSPSKKAKLQDPESSVTEPEEFDWEKRSTLPTIAASNPATTQGRAIPKTSASLDSGSDTEPESEPDPFYPEPEYFPPRPAFPLKPGQRFLEPLTLDLTHQVPARINTFLREYQREGIRFFWDRYKEGKGGLLGDDMGLGKTIQVISFLSAIMRKRGDYFDTERRRKHVSRLQDGPDWKKRRALPPANATWPTCLIVAPSSVVGNWEREFQTWGFFELGMYIGPPASRAEVLHDFKLGRLDVLVTSFEVARSDIDLIDELPWSCIFIDEVHRVKNPKSKLATAFGRFTTPCRYGLSGTVIQNGYEELWTVLNWTNPGAVGTKKQWDQYVEKPLRVGQSKSASDEEHVTAALVAKVLTEKLLPRLFLRRTKHIIQDQLPNKTDQVVFCPLTATQIYIYKRILGLDEVAGLIRKDELCDCGSRQQRKKCCHPMRKGALFRYMSSLIKVSNHLALILPSPSDTIEQTARTRELCSVVFPNGNVPKYGMSMLKPNYCGKWNVLNTLLQRWRKDASNKVLLFTKSVKLLEMLEFHLDTQGFGFVKLDGSTKQSHRMSIIDKFQEDQSIFVFLISTMAGGTGLNLTAANKVVIFDPNWNPAHDLQAMDRAYRFGQTRDVEVYRLLGAGSIEELIYARQVYKQQQMQVGYNASLQTRYFEGVQGDKTKQGELFGIKNIFKLHENTLATKMAIERANVSDLDWAFAYMGGGGSAAKRPKTKPEGVKWVYEEEAKTGREYDDLRGLGAMLFDDAAPEVTIPPNDIEKTLSAMGVRYTHRNDDLIAESAIEGQRMQKLIEEKKAAAKKAKERREAAKKGKDKEPEPEWPPRRRHHKRAPSPRSKLRIRQRALIEQGLLQKPEDLPKFAMEFAQKTLDEQTDFLAQLDDYAKKHFKY